MLSVPSYPGGSRLAGISWPGCPTRSCASTPGRRRPTSTGAREPLKIIAMLGALDTPRRPRSSGRRGYRCGRLARRGCSAIRRARGPHPLVDRAPARSRSHARIAAHRRCHRPRTAVHPTSREGHPKRCGAGGTQICCLSSPTVAVVLEYAGESRSQIKNRVEIERDGSGEAKSQTQRSDPSSVHRGRISFSFDQSQRETQCDISDTYHISHRRETTHGPSRLSVARGSGRGLAPQ